MENHVHLLKLSVGTDSVDSLAEWQSQYARRFEDGLPRHVTRMWPKRQAQIEAGGSIFWVIKGLIQARQPIVRLDRVTASDGTDRCAIVLSPGLIRTTAAPRRPFQGWRYLEPADAPQDLPHNRQAEDSLPPTLAGALAEIGVI